MSQLWPARPPATHGTNGNHRSIGGKAQFSLRSVGVARIKITRPSWDERRGVIARSICRRRRQFESAGDGYRMNRLGRVRGNCRAEGENQRHQ